jgi:hypothetical protein
MCDDSGDRVEVENASNVCSDQQLDDSRQRRREYELTALEADLRDPFLASQFAVHSLGERRHQQRCAQQRHDRCFSDGGGLRVWSLMHPEDDPGDEEPTLVRYGVGDAVLMDSYRLHQIEEFDGETDRVSVTLHGFHLDRGRWETWF